MKKIILLTCVAMTLSKHILAQQEDKKSPFSLLIAGALELGGDEVAKVYFTNGEDQSVKAGQGGTISVGTQFRLPAEKRFLLRTTIGFKYVTTQADNAHIRLARFPIHLTANWLIDEKFRLGAGVVTHQGINFKADGIGQDIKFSGATGPVFEVAYKGIGLSYTLLNYKDQANINYSANAVGLTFSGTIQNFSKKPKQK